MVQDIVKDLQQMAAQPELDLMSTQTHSSLSGGEYSPMSAVYSVFLLVRNPVVMNFSARLNISVGW